MPRKAGPIPPLTTAERQARIRQRKASKAAEWRTALERILSARTIREAREIAQTALEYQV